MGDEIWGRIRAGDQAVRNEAIEAHLPLVRYTALRLKVGLPNSIEVDDLVSYGTFGLIEALDRFDPDRGLQFSTYAVNRIRGAMIDGLRSMDWAPRRVRREARQLTNAADDLNVHLEREPTTAEVAEKLEQPVEKVVAMMSEAVLAQGAVSLDVPVPINEEGRDTTLGDQLAGIDDPEEATVVDDLGRMLAAGLSRLCLRDRAVIALHYLEDLSFSDMSRLLGVTESRIFQIHSRAMKALREAVAI